MSYNTAFCLFPQIDHGSGVTLARLEVAGVQTADEGVYSCVPAGSHPASVLVHVHHGQFYPRGRPQNVPLGFKRVIKSVLLFSFIFIAEERSAAAK